MKKILEWTALLVALLALAGCAEKKAAEPKWEESLYRTVVYNSGEDESDAKYLEIAQRSQKLLALLEEKAGAVSLGKRGVCKMGLTLYGRFRYRNVCGIPL